MEFDLDISDNEERAPELDVDPLVSPFHQVYIRQERPHGGLPNFKLKQVGQLETSTVLYKK